MPPLPLDYHRMGRERCVRSRQRQREGHPGRHGHEGDLVEERTLGSEHEFIAITHERDAELGVPLVRYRYEFMLGSERTLLHEIPLVTVTAWVSLSLPLP